MTITEQTPVNEFVASGTNGTFSFTFRILDNADLIVSIDEVIKTEITDYTIENITDLGGDVVFVVTPDSGELIKLLRDTAIDQETVYNPFDPFPAKTHEAALDKLTMISQELNIELGDTTNFTRRNEDEIITGDWAFSFVNGLRISDLSSNLRKAGFRNPGDIGIADSESFIQAMEGQVADYVGAVGTLVVNQLEALTTMTLDHHGTGLVTLEEGAGVTISWRDGSGTLKTGPRTVSINSIVQLRWRLATDVIIWGNGIV